MARSTVSAVVVRLGLHRLRFLEPRKLVQRYEKSRPGELLHLDTKKLARIKRIGHRIHGDRSLRVEGAGWEYAHVCVDDYSRVAYVELLNDEQGLTASGFLEWTIAWFAQLGVRTEAALTDNGACYRSRAFATICQQHAIKHRRTKPYRPQTNGKAERFIQTLSREWAYGKPYHTSRGRRQALPAWLKHYNRKRRHTHLDNLSPAEFESQSTAASAA